METIEQKNRRELVERFKIARGKYTLKEIGEAYGSGKWNIGLIEQKLKDGKRLFPRTIRNMHKALDKLKIPREEAEFFDDVMQSLKEADNYFKGKKSGCRVHIPKGE